MRVLSVSRRALSLCLFALFLVAAARFVAAQTPQPPATIYLIRHAEKLTDGESDLSATGFKRAAVLANLFAPPSGERTAPALATPQVLFATHASKHSNRPVETITPLAAALHLPIHSDILNEDYAALAHELLSGRYAGEVVLVAWHHGKLPELATALGAVPPYTPWPDTQFDRIWRIDYVNGKATLTDLPQELLPGDSK
ncbi:histidine phosphatase family protein [Granulicella arctica]|uniref:Histidine phosphatase family protein n=1 Tax=Granulicella arctica TaxID=940613 RepID=A0A7Y9PKW7_9BACT|nr:histidine phosphatase family protein [Granulicella arctica]NYF80991.1 hypothetical protein [Granulicella arctica]